MAGDETIDEEVGIMTDEAVEIDLVVEDSEEMIDMVAVMTDEAVDTMIEGEIGAEVMKGEDDTK